MSSSQLRELVNLDLLNTVALLALLLSLCVAYAVRVAFKGRAHFDRVDEQGSSKFLAKGVMEMAYWGMQPIAHLFVAVGITPNFLSWCSLMTGILAGVCLAFGHFGFGALFSAVSALLDTLDGMVARLSHRASDAGEVLDAAVDRYAEFFFLAGLVVYYRPVPTLLVLALAALCGSFMVSYSTAKAEALNVKLPKGGLRRPERAVLLTLGAALSPITIPWLELYRDYSISIGHPMVIALALVALFSNKSAIERLVYIAKTIRQREKVQTQMEKDSSVVATVER